MTIEDDIRREERATYLALGLAGALPVAGWLIRGGAAGAGITLCIAMIALAGYGLMRTRRRVALPRATRRR